MVAAINVDTRLPLPSFIHDLPYRIPVADFIEPPPVSSRERLLFHTFSVLEDLPLGRVWPIWARPPSVGLVLALSDLIPEDRLNAHLRGSRYLMIEQADAIIADSVTTANNIMGRTIVDPRRVSVARLGVSERYEPSTRTDGALAELTREQGVHGNYLLAVDSGPGLPYLFRAYASLPSVVRANQRLIAVFSGSDQHQLDSLRGEVSGLGLVNQIVVLSEVDEAAMVTLYQGCRAFVFPSFDRGRALPAIAAMRCGAPTIVSDVGPLPEIVQSREARFDPSNEPAMAAAIERILTDEQFLESRRQAGSRDAARYSWESWEVAVVDAYEQAAGRRPRH
jgi:glycosyltransferase involved in cell wall biosynthesis